MKYRANSQDTWHKIKVKALDGMPVGSIVEYDGQVSDIPSGWEQQGNDYSTDEIDTGKTWIDGKKIYRKVFTGQASSTDALTVEKYSSGITSVDTIIKLEGTITDETNIVVAHLGGELSSTDNNNVSFLYYEKDTKKYCFSRGGSYKSGYYNIIMEYTK